MGRLVVTQPVLLTLHSTGQLNMRDRLIDLIIPAILIIGCLVLLVLGIDGEVKVILTMAGVWAFKTAVFRPKS